MGPHGFTHILKKSSRKLAQKEKSDFIPLE